MSDILVEVKHLKKYFPIKGGLLFRTIGYVRAVDDVSFYIKPKETLGLVGESGCGKTTCGYLILRLLEPTDGKIYYRGKDLLELDKDEMKRLRQHMQIIFQDPLGSLNPRKKVGDLIAEPLLIHGIAGKGERDEKVYRILEKVGLNPDHAKRFPHEFSGGQQQRIGIARALILNPEFLVLDEAVAALDVSIRAQIINLLKDLQREFGLTYLFISHDLSVVRYMSDRVAVMYVGEMVEMASKKNLFASPQHPYTQALISAIPIPDPGVKREEIILKGEVPSPVNPPPGCRFHTRCPYAKEICKKERPTFIDIGDEHYVACHNLSS